MNFAQYNGSAADYIREYLDPDNTLSDSPTSDDEARALWASMNDVFSSDGGAGISEEEFLAGVRDIQRDAGIAI